MITPKLTPATMISEGRDLARRVVEADATADTTGASDDERARLRSAGVSAHYATRSARLGQRQAA